MKRILALALLVFSGLCFAQAPAPITTSQVNLPFTALVPVSTANVALVGNPGQQTYYYWIVANYTVGSTSPSGPFMAGNAPATLGVANYINVTPIYPIGASLDLLRTTSPIAPTGSCNCAVATAVTSGTIADQSNALLSYSVAPGFIAPNYVLTLDNEVVGFAATHLILRQNGDFVADLNIGGGGGSGNVTGPSISSLGNLACWNNLLGTLLADCGFGLPLPNGSLQNSAVTVNGVPISLGASGTITAAPSGAATGDLGGTYPGPTVKGVDGVPLCTGFTPTTGQALEYTTASSPNPCYTAATITPSLSNPMTTLGDFLYGGVTGTPTRLPGATTPNGVPEVLVSIPSGGLATAPALALPGIPGRSVVITSDTILSTDCNPKRVVYTGSSAVSVTLPTPTTLGIPSCTTKLVNSTSSTVTITPTTWTISAAGGTPGATLALAAGQEAVLFVDPSTANNWSADLTTGTGSALPSGAFGEPLVNASGSTAYSTSALFIDASQESGATLDVKLNNANARAITNKVPKVEASSLNGTQTLAAQANIGQLSAPVFTSTPNAGPYANGTYKGAYTLTSPVVTGETSASAESTFTISGCGSGCQINMATPTYFGTATSYSPYLTVAGGGSWTEDKCAGNANTAIGTNAAIVAACSGAAVSTSNQGFPVHLVLPAQGVWNVSITDGTSCGLKFFDQSSSRGVESGEGRPFFVGATSSATSVDSLICTDNNAKNNKGYYKLEGLAAEDIAGDNIATGVLTFRNTFDVSVLSYPHVGTHSNAVGLALVGNCCSSTVVSPQVEGAGVGQPLAIGAAGSTSGNELSLLIIGGSFVHSGAGNPNIVIAGAIGGTAAGSIDFSGTTYMECSVTNTVDLIQVGSQGNVVGPIHFDDVRIGGGTCGGTNAGGQYIFDVGLGGNTVGNFSVDRTFNGAMTNLFRYPNNTAKNVNGLSANTTYPNLTIDNNNPVTILSTLSAFKYTVPTGTSGSQIAGPTDQNLNISASGGNNLVLSAPSTGSVSITGGVQTQLADGSGDTLTLLGGTITASTPLLDTAAAGFAGNGSGAGQEFNCAANYANLKACLDAAKTYVGNANTGSDKAAYVRLPSGTVSLGSPPYTLNSGMNIIGVAPRVKYVAGTSADLNMVPNGGTWIDCGGLQCFTGNQLRGISISDVGFQNFCTAGVSGCSVFTFGGNGNPGVDGVAWSYFYDLIAIGSTTAPQTDMAWVFYNSQHINGSFMTAFDVNVGLNLISQGLEAPMNSVFSDIYTYTYPKSAANGNNAKPGLWLQCLADSGSNTSGLAFISILRPQVNSYNGDNTGTNIRFDASASGCAVEDVDLLDVDAEGPQLDAIYMNGATHNHVRYMGYSGSPSGPTNTVHVTATSGFNLIESEDNNAVLKVDSGGNAQNIYVGAWASETDTGTLKRGQFWQGTPNQGVWDYNDYGWYAQGVSFGNFGSGVLAAEWDGAAATPVFTDASGKEGLFFNSSLHVVEISGNGAEMAYISPTSTSVIGNFFMGAAPSGGTQTTTPLCSYTLSTFFSFAPCAKGFDGTLNAGPALLGTSAVNTVISSTVANAAGHFTNIQVVTALGGTCSTLPQFNVFDGTSTTGSTVTASASTQTKGTGNSTAQTLTFAAGDVIGIYISTAGGTCTSDSFIVSAEYSIP